MVTDRPDWCISRQKSWGLPIPAFYCEKCGKALLDPHVIRNVAKVFGERGSTLVVRTPGGGLPARRDEVPPLRRGRLSQGNRHLRRVVRERLVAAGVLRTEPELLWPADLYLEGHDQHRGWFQLSLLVATAAENAAPYRTVLTHGFVIDEKGDKMSKSLGNFISVEDALKEFGAEIVRLWVSSVNFRDDINVSRDLIGRLSDAYRRVRNTFKYLLGNLHDFDPDTDAVATADLLEIDRWALAELARLVDEVTRACESYTYHRVYNLVYRFCVVEMSSFYLDILKDRLYCEGNASRDRRSAQTVLFRILDALVRMLAPILAHTAEEVWQVMPGRRDAESVHLAAWPTGSAGDSDDALAARWERMIGVRGEVMKSLEALRAAKTIGGSLEAAVTLYTEDEELYAFLKSFEADLATIMIVSEAKVILGTHPEAAQSEEIPALHVHAFPSSLDKCKRCWNLRDSVGKCADHAALCERCAKVVDNS